MSSPIRAKANPSFAPIRVHSGFEAEFPNGERSAAEVVLNLTFAGVAAVNRVDDLLAPFGLVLKSFNVLAVVAGDPSPLTPTVIGERTLIVKTSVTAVLDRLEVLGLVRRRPHPTSRRSIQVELTKKGASVCANVLRRLHAAEARWVAGMTERDRQTLIRLLGEVKGLLNRHASGDDREEDGHASGQ